MTKEDKVFFKTSMHDLKFWIKTILLMLEEKN